MQLLRGGSKACTGTVLSIHLPLCADSSIDEKALTLMFEQLRQLVENKINKLGARTLGARSRGSKNVTYIQQTTDKKVNTEEKSQKYGVIL